jgi:pimeloyl-ACP methyl ester carboxylesterase
MPRRPAPASPGRPQAAATAKVARRTPAAPALAAAALALVLALLAGCASGPPLTAGPAEPGAAPPTPAFTTLPLAGAEITAEWQWPAAAPAALMLLQHGFGRQCANLRGTAQRIAAAGVATLCLNADMAAGQPELADALALALRRGLAGPDGQPLPQRLIVGGHSAGALFGARVGSALAAQAPQRLAGALLLDPVGGAPLTQALLDISDGGHRPVRAVLALPSRCNARQLALPALAEVQRRAQAAGGDSYLGVLLIEGSTHVDAEGEDTDFAAVWACGEGRPQPANTELLRTLAARWAGQMAGGDAGVQAIAAEPASVDALAPAGRLRRLP